MPDAIPLIFDKIKKQNFHPASHILALLQLIIGISAVYPLAAWPRIPISIAINSHFLFLHEALFAFCTLSSKTAESLTRLVYFWVTTYLPIWSLVFHRSESIFNAKHFTTILHGWPSPTETPRFSPPSRHLGKVHTATRNFSTRENFSLSSEQNLRSAMIKHKNMKRWRRREKAN